MEATHPHGRAAGLATLALAAAAAVVLGVGDAVGFTSADAEALFIALWLVGWTLLSWAALTGAVGAARLVRQLVSRRHPAWGEVAVVVAGIAVVVAVVGAHPLWGSGSGTG